MLYVIMMDTILQAPLFILSRGGLEQERVLWLTQYLVKHRVSPETNITPRERTSGEEG